MNGKKAKALRWMAALTAHQFQGQYRARKYKQNSRTGQIVLASDCARKVYLNIKKSISKEEASKVRQLYLKDVNSRGLLPEA